VTAARTRAAWSRGQTGVEFAWVATAFLLFIAGVMMMGEAVMAYNSMSAAAEEAVRYAVANGPNSINPASLASIQQIAVNTSPQLHLTQTTYDSNGNILTTGNVTASWVTDPNMASGSGWKDALVVITYNYSLKIPFMSAITLHLTATSQMMESQGPTT
jgi:Flp pilus assembly protein TadG